MSYIPNSRETRKQMLQEIGISDFADLIKSIPENTRLYRPLKLPGPLSEMELEAELNRLSEKNTRVEANFAGGGAYDHFSPAAIDHILLRSEFYTAYTPYQAEVAQGTLQAIYEFQTFISRLTGMEVTNASMYDGATALAEAIMMALHHTGRHEVLYSEALNPHYLETVRAYLAGQKCRLKPVTIVDGVTDHGAFVSKVSAKTAAVIIQNPNFFGLIERAGDFSQKTKETGALYIMVYDPLSLGVLAPPGECGADIAVAEGQCLGLPLNFGGPYLGLLSAHRNLLRKVPGRLSGRTKDKNGNTGYVLTLQTREQHIRRERATSNICTNQALCALAATVYLSLLGKIGLEKIGRLCLSKSHYAAARISAILGYSLKFKGPFFKEFVVDAPVSPSSLVRRLSKNGIVPGVDMGRFRMGLKGCLMVAVTEKRTKEQIDRLVAGLAAAV